MVACLLSVETFCVFTTIIHTLLSGSCMISDFDLSKFLDYVFFFQRLSNYAITTMINIFIDDFTADNFTILCEYTSDCATPSRSMKFMFDSTSCIILKISCNLFFSIICIIWISWGLNRKPLGIEALMNS